MGLDQYAYATSSLDTEDKDELATWRKHNRLHGWMEQLWEDKGRPNFSKGIDEQPMGDFNCVALELTLSDIEQLEAHVTNKALPETGGFFFGDDSYGNYENPDFGYKQEDLEFIELAYKALKQGKKVYYDSWW